LARARALDNQVFVASISPARDEGAGYVAWGHSVVLDPWGQVLASVKSENQGEEIIVADIDLARLKEVRDQVPITKQRREDLFDMTSMKK